jgi:transposase
MKAYSLDLRTKIVDCVRRRGVSISETARRFGVNRSTVGRYLKRLDEEGSLAPKKAPGSRPKLDESAMRLLEEDIKARPWATHGQRKVFLFAACGVEVSQTTICRAIKKLLSHSRKKIHGSQRERRMAQSGVAFWARWARRPEISVCRRDGHPHLASSFVWLLAPWAEGLLQDPKKQGYEHDAAIEHELGGDGAFDGYRRFYDQGSL